MNSESSSLQIDKPSLYSSDKIVVGTTRFIALFLSQIITKSDIHILPLGSYEPPPAEGNKVNGAGDADSLTAESDGNPNSNEYKNTMTDNAHNSNEPEPEPEPEPEEDITKSIPSNSLHTFPPYIESSPDTPIRWIMMVAFYS